MSWTRYWSDSPGGLRFQDDGEAPFEWRSTHAQLTDGTVLTDVEIFRAIWDAVGLRFLPRVNRRHLIAPLIVKAYAWFARNRLWRTGCNRTC